MKWRGERIRLVSCCGPMDPTAVRLALETAYQRVRDDLDALGLQRIRVPPLGSSSEPYVLRIVSPPGTCPVVRYPDGTNAPARGCSVTEIKSRHTWGVAVAVDGPRDREAPYRHEPEHRWCLLLRAQLRTFSLADLRRNLEICMRAGHKVDDRRLNVLGE